MRLRRTTTGVIAIDEARSRWVDLPAAARQTGRTDLEQISSDVLTFLASGQEAIAAAESALCEVAEASDVVADPSLALLPFRPRSLRAFSVWEQHMVSSARAMTRRFFPPGAARVTDGFERATGRTFPRFKPKSHFYEVPAFYMGNHTAVSSDGDDVATASAGS